MEINKFEFLSSITNDQESDIGCCDVIRNLVCHQAIKHQAISSMDLIDFSHFGERKK